MEMNKSELVDKVAEEAGVSQADAARHLEAVIEIVTGALKQGDEVQITGFGKFYANERAAREGRNPRTGEAMTIPAARVPSFSAGSALKKAL